MIKIGICEDVEEELINQQKFVIKIMEELSLVFRVICFQKGEDLLFALEKKQELDIILMDIELDGINGIQTARKIREKDLQVILIFISSYDRYYGDIVKLYPFDFLDKPVSKESLMTTLKKASTVVGKRRDFFEFNYKKIHHKIFLSQICYFESSKRVVYLHGVGEIYSFYRKLDEVEKELEQSSLPFIRVHKSYLINPNYIEEYHYKKIVMMNGREIKISRSYQDSVRKFYMREMGEEMIDK